MKRVFHLSFICVALLSLWACSGSSGGAAGGSSGGGSTGGTGSSSDTSTTGVATVAALNTLPSTDISNIDYSSGAGSSLIKSLTSKKATVSGVPAKFLGENIGGVDDSSREGCEYNMMKKELKREGSMTTQPKCATEVMAEFGLIVIPGAGSSTTYLIDPPDGGDQEAFCDDIPDEAVQEKEHCESGEGPGGPGGTILMTVGKTSAGALQLDVCEGDDKIMEGEYSASGTVYDIDVRSIFKGFFEEGGEDKMRFDGTIDIGDDGKVEKGVVTLGTDGDAVLTLTHEGSFGKGRMVYTANPNTKENEVMAYWNGNFTDPFTGVTNSFEDKVYALVGQTTGCAKFEYGGDMPPESIQNLMPQDVDENDLDNTLDALSGEIGIELTPENYQSVFVCFNDGYDWENPDPAEKPMIPLQSGATSCPDVMHTDVGCFDITNVTVNKDYGTETKQIFTVIDPADASQFATVNAFDLSTISSTVETPAYARGSSCDPTGATPVAFETLTFEQARVFQENIERCFELSEDARGEGMEDHNCGDQMMAEATNDFVEAGPPSWCYAGGDHQLKAAQPTQCPRIFFNDCLSDPNSNGNGEYCMPSYQGCSKYTLVNGMAENLSLPITTEETEGDATVIGVGFNGGTTACVEMSAVYRLSNGSQVDCSYTCFQPTFNAPPDEGEHDYVEGAEAGEAGFVNPVCLDAKITDPETCDNFCREVDCGPPPGDS